MTHQSPEKSILFFGHLSGLLIRIELSLLPSPLSICYVMCCRHGWARALPLGPVTSSSHPFTGQRSAGSATMPAGQLVGVLWPSTRLPCPPQDAKHQQRYVLNHFTRDGTLPNNRTHFPNPLQDRVSTNLDWTWDSIFIYLMAKFRIWRRSPVSSQERRHNIWTLLSSDWVVLTRSKFWD